MRRTAKLVDSSYDLLTVQEARCLMDAGAGVWGFAQCLLALPLAGPERPATRVQSLENARAAGLRTAGYVLVGASLPGQQYVTLARQGMPDGVWDALEFVAVDIETPHVNVLQAVQAFDQLRAYGKRDEVLYTSYHSWTSLVLPRNSTVLSERGVKLWNAYWDGAEDIDYASLPYGGWKVEDVVIEQYTGGSTVCGQYVDRNVADLDWLESLREEDEMALADDVRAMSERLARLEQGVWALAKHVQAEGYEQEQIRVGVNTHLEGHAALAPGEALVELSAELQTARAEFAALVEHLRASPGAGG